MAANKIDSYLERLRNITPPDEAVRSSAQKIIAEVAGLKLSKESISLRRGVLYIQAGPVVKSEIFLKKQKIIRRFSESLGKSAPSDIR